MKPAQVGENTGSWHLSRCVNDASEFIDQLQTAYMGSDIKIEGEDHLILREDDILAVIEK